ncbi:MAG TPA: right-handed parallel beta-helix repeat-containing protein [Rubrobacteraceae bacterium]|nr:right-handed parallel beta-helix repeat-containing protein [Rubrobacteraceae bacterium]
MSMEGSNNLRIVILALLVGFAALLVATVSFGARAQAAPVSDPLTKTLSLDSVCDVSLVAVGKGVPGDPSVIEVPTGWTVKLLDDPSGDGTPGVYECNPVAGPVFDPKTKTTVTGLVSGDGISVDAPGVTFDLNGHSIASTKDILAASAPADVENAGVSIGANNVVVTNSSTVRSVVSNFTTNFSVAKSNDSRISGSKLADGTYNLKGGNAHGGASLSVDKSLRLTVDTVELSDLSGDGTSTEGVDWKRCSGPTGTIQNSLVQGDLGGMRFKGCQSGGLSVLNNHVIGHGGSGVEFMRDNKGATVSGNTIEGSTAGDGVTVRAPAESISITSNTIQNNAGFGIQTIGAVKSITTTPNTFANNALGNVGVK